MIYLKWKDSNLNINKLQAFKIYKNEENIKTVKQLVNMITFLFL